MSSHIEYQHFRRGENCSDEGCRARKFYIEDGKKFCQRGHEQIGYTQTQQDEDDWNAQGKVSRKKRADKVRETTILSGIEARELYLQCFQLVLWKQCHWLVSVKRFSPELETIVRDLWGLRLDHVHQRRETHSGYSSTTETMIFSSTSEGDSTESHSSRKSHVRSTRGSKRRRISEKLPRLAETLGICFLGILLSQLPISLSQFFDWAIHDEIIYNRAIKDIPKEMRARLPPYYRSSFEVRAPLKSSTLQIVVLDLVQFFTSNFGMVFPPLNYPLLLFRHIRDLALPIEIYGAVQSLAALLDIDFSYTESQKRKPGVIAYPEVQLICLVVIATKLSHPFDDIIRVPPPNANAAAMKTDWLSWREVMMDGRSGATGPSEDMGINESDVFGMDWQRVDKYLDWYQRVWIDDQVPKVSEPILESFPLAKLSLPVKDIPNLQNCGERPKKVQQGLKILTPDISTSTQSKSPGEGYRRYKSVEDVPQSAILFFDLAASSVGTSVEMLVQAVYRMERRLMTWVLEDRRQEQKRDVASETNSEEEWTEEGG